MSDATKCDHCDHIHTSAKWGFICIGCPCPIRPNHDFLDDGAGEGVCQHCGEDRSAHDIERRRSTSETKGAKP